MEDEFGGPAPAWCSSDRVPQVASWQALRRNKLGPMLIDLRQPLSFAKEFIPGSLNIPSIETFEALAPFIAAHQHKIYAIAERQDATLDAVCRAIDVAAWLKPEIIQAWRSTQREVGRLE